MFKARETKYDKMEICTYIWLYVKFMSNPAIGQVKLCVFCVS